MADEQKEEGMAAILKMRKQSDKRRGEGNGAYTQMAKETGKGAAKGAIMGLPEAVPSGGMSIIGGAALGGLKRLWQTPGSLMSKITFTTGTIMGVAAFALFVALLPIILILFPFLVIIIWWYS